MLTWRRIASAARLPKIRKNQARQATTAHTQAETGEIPTDIAYKQSETAKNLREPAPKGDPETQAFSDLLTQPIPVRESPISPIEAFEKVKQTAQDVKPEPVQPRT